MARIIVELNVCLDGCSQCMDECPMQMLRFEKASEPSQLIIEEEMCIECRNCEVTCPLNALKVESVDQV